MRELIEYKEMREAIARIRGVLDKNLETEFIYKYGSSYGFGYQHLREEILKALDGKQE